MSGQLRESMNHVETKAVSRREFIRLAGMLGVSMSAAQALLAACGPEPTASPTPMPPTATIVAEPAPGASPTSAPGVPRRGGVLRYSCPHVTEVDPALLEDVGGNQFVRTICDFLVRINHRLEAVPSLAESWEASEDGKTWTFSLRQGVRFHDGSPFTADDVLFSLNRMIDMGTAVASLLGYVEEIEKVDDYTVRFHLQGANADLPYHLGDYHMLMLSHKWEGDFYKNPVGTGPFKLKELIVGEHATFVRNEDYWQEGLPYLDEVQHIYIPEAVTRVSALLAGEIDIADKLPLELVDALKADPNTEVGVPDQTGHVVVHMRADAPPWNDNRVRLALKYCIDREQMREAVLKGYGALGNDHPIAPAWTEWWTDIGYRERDIEKAKALLAEAGYADGLDLELATNTTQAYTLDTAVAVQEMAKDAGFRITVSAMTAPLYWDIWLEVPFGVTGWSSRATPTEFLRMAYLSDAEWNEAHYSNAKLDELIEAVSTTADKAERKKLYEQIERLLADEGAGIIAFHTVDAQGYRKRVQGFNPGTSGRHFVDSVWLSG